MSKDLSISVKELKELWKEKEWTNYSKLKKDSLMQITGPFYYNIDKRYNGYIVENILSNRKNGPVWINIVPKEKETVWEYEKQVIKKGEWNLFWRYWPVVRYQEEVIPLYNIPKASPSLLQIVNHLPNPLALTDKANMIQIFKREFKDPFEFTPQTFLFPKNSIAQEYKDFEEFAIDMHQDFWIVKPQDELGGKGIELFKYSKQALDYIKKANKEGLDLIIQKYIQNPFLYRKRKFDVRVNVLVLDTMEMYISNFGFLRTATENFTLENTDKYVHITNTKLQKTSKKFGKYEEGNTLSFSQYKNLSGIDIENEYFPIWKNIIKKTILAGKEDLLNNNIENRRSFSLFGFDFLIDENKKSWLIELNVNPGLNEDVRWSKKLLHGFFEEIINITIDSKFDIEYKKRPYKFFKKF